MLPKPQLRRPDAPNGAIAANNRRRKTVLRDLHDAAGCSTHRAEPRGREGRDQGVDPVSEEQHGPDRVPGSYDVQPSRRRTRARPRRREGILDPPPCGYLITDEQYRSQQDNSRSAGDRLAAHGISRTGPTIGRTRSRSGRRPRSAVVVGDAESSRTRTLGRTSGLCSSQGHLAGEHATRPSRAHVVRETRTAVVTFTEPHAADAHRGAATATHRASSALSTTSQTDAEAFIGAEPGRRAPRSTNPSVRRARNDASTR